VFLNFYGSIPYQRRAKLCNPYQYHFCWVVEASSGEKQAFQPEKVGKVMTADPRFPIEAGTRRFSPSIA
jgi:hypothetical protein